MCCKNGGRTMNGDMYLAWASNEENRNKADCGGAVTALLKFALESGLVDAVLAIKARDGDRYDGIPVLITDPEEIKDTAGVLHSSSINIPRYLKEYMAGVYNRKLAVVCKPCDARALIELTKRDVMHLENLLLIGLNCTGTFSPVTAKEMFKEKFGVNPSDVIKEEIEDGKLKIRLKDETEVERDLKILEEEGYGRRENCRRCEINIPTMTDIACGRWGATDEKKTFIEVCSDKGSNLIESAIEADSIKVERPNSEAIETRRKQDALAIKLAQEWQEKDFAPFKAMSADERFSYWFSQFNQCIKCFGCRDACPICFCEHCMLEADRGYVSGGEIPPDPLWPMVRIVHVMDSCINCGQCQDACPMELPLAKLIFMLNKEVAPRFDYEPGINVESRAPSATVTDTELTIDDVALFLKKSV